MMNLTIIKEKDTAMREIIELTIKVSINIKEKDKILEKKDEEVESAAKHLLIDGPSRKV